MDDVTHSLPPGRIAESLDRSEAQVAAGDTVALDPVLGRLRASIARMRGARMNEEPEAAGKVFYVTADIPGRV